jgi:hypothetical protein
MSCNFHKWNVINLNQYQSNMKIIKCNVLCDNCGEIKNAIIKILEI